MIPHLEADYCSNDEVYYSRFTSAVFEIDGQHIYIVRSYDHYIQLRRVINITHRIKSLERCAGLLYCTMEGSDGSETSFYLTEDGLANNMKQAQEVAEIQTVPHIC